MNESVEIVVTTIHPPAWLQGYLDNLRRHGRDAHTRISIIADRKTPSAVFAAAAAARAQGFEIWCPALEEQERYLKRLGAADGFIPWDSDNRRNIGFLTAVERRADVLISIDDDNYCPTHEDFVGAHLVVGRPPARDDRPAPPADWFNLCSLLETTPAVPIFPRGFPYYARTPSAASAADRPGADSGGRIAVNAGLWLTDPDVDAVTRLCLAPKATAARPGGVVLGAPTWTPINSQNTALIAPAIPAYYYVRMGCGAQGFRIDRFGDILSGYFLQKCAKHLGDMVRIGPPVCAHRRSPHNLLHDLSRELNGIALNEDLLPWLREVRLEGADYIEVYASLAEAIATEAGRFRGSVWEAGGAEFLADTARCMRHWLELTARAVGACTSA